MSPGIERVDCNELLLFDQSYSERLNLRESLLQQNFDDIVGVANESNSRIQLAVQELYDYLFQTYLPVRYPSIFKPYKGKGSSPTMVQNVVTGQILPMTMADSMSLRVALETITKNVDEDFFILLPQKQGKSSEDVYVLEAYAACFPSGFKPKEKIGKKLADIHGPVPGYKEKLQKSMDRYFARLEVGSFVKRVNWSLTVDEELFSNFDKSKPAFEGELEKLSLEDLNLENVCYFYSVRLKLLSPITQSSLHTDIPALRAPNSSSPPKFHGHCLCFPHLSLPDSGYQRRGQWRGSGSGYRWT